jgi:hypothetical protein
VAGGQSGNVWTNEVNYYDIFLGRFNSVGRIDDLPETLLGPSMSSEFFGDIGLVVCGQN